MEENDKEIVTQENDTETTENEQDIVDDSTNEDSTQENDSQEVDIEAIKKENEELKKKNATLAAQKEHFKKKSNKSEAQKIDSNLSTSDILFLSKVELHEEDMPEVIEWAKFKKIDVKSAYNQLKPTLDIKNEQRKTANVTMTGKTQRGVSKITGEDLLAKAETTGEVPDDTEGLNKLFMARQARKFKR